jgi:hypothetical protein
MERILRDSIEESARENGSIICFERGECMKKKTMRILRFSMEFFVILYTIL